MESYANARKVLPPRILAQVQKHFQGGLLWVPPVSRRLRKTAGNHSRNELMLRAYKAGTSLSQLALKHGLSHERVRQILKSKRGT